VTREGRLPRPEAPWDWDERRVESDLPTEDARWDPEPVALAWESRMGTGEGMGIGLDIVAGVTGWDRAIGNKLSSFGVVQSW
jgi:hypothetical protein